MACFVKNFCIPIATVSAYKFFTLLLYELYKYCATALNNIFGLNEENVSCITANKNHGDSIRCVCLGTYPEKLSKFRSLLLNSS